ncbi:MAG: hypothetical protein RR349_04710, partial [Oscillospiraceae bacterium]
RDTRKVPLSARSGPMRLVGRSVGVCVIHNAIYRQPLFVARAIATARKGRFMALGECITGAMQLHCKNPTGGAEPPPLRRV